MKPFQDTPNPKGLFNSIRDAITPAAKKFSQTVKPVGHMANMGSKVLGLVPAGLQAGALEPMLNHALQELIDNGDFDFLEGHCCAIAVRDRNLAWHIGFDGQKLRVQPNQTAGVTISATVPAFLNLISQHADPDTLFFQRQLSIDGDVELGLYVKNMLDALDEDDLPLVWRKALASLRQLIAMETDNQD